MHRLNRNCALSAILTAGRAQFGFTFRKSRGDLFFVL